MVRAAVNSSLRLRQSPQSPRDKSTAEQSRAQRGHAGRSETASCALHVGHSMAAPYGGSHSLAQATHRGGKSRSIVAESGGCSHRRSCGRRRAFSATELGSAVTLALAAFVLTLFASRSYRTRSL